MSGDFDSPARRIGETLAASLIGAIWGLRVTGLERVPRAGPLIVAANHVSLWDPPLLAAALAPARRPRFLGKKELFALPLAGRLFRAAGAIPLDRGGPDIPALREALATLEGGGSIAIFPEGTRARPGAPRRPKAGVGFLAARTRAAVLPVRLFGTAEFPRVFPLEARVGAPLPPPAAGGRAAAEEFARAVLSAVYAL